jgi:hypothetical protein
MNPYSHIVVASKLVALVQPEDLKEYYWGAVAPDIRYLAAVQRQHTHIPPQRVIDFISRYPNLKSFLQGYLVHCLSDEVDLKSIFFQHFPFSILKSKLSYQHVAVLLELFCLANEKVNTPLSGAHNAVLTELGLDEAVSARLSYSINHYIIALPAEARLSELFRLLGPQNDRRVERYAKVAVGFQQNWLLRNALFLGIRRGKIDEKIVSEVKSLLSTLQSGSEKWNGTKDHL